MLLYIKFLCALWPSSSLTCGVGPLERGSWGGETTAMFPLGLHAVGGPWPTEMRLCQGTEGLHKLWAFTSSPLRRRDRSALPLCLLCEQEEAKGEVLLPGESPGVFLQLCARNLLPFLATWTAPPWGPPLLPVPQQTPEPPSGGLNCQTLTPPPCSLRACPSH